ncbi:MAG: hypothetical protein KC900_03485 [Candidatus Omnitrophica bacterium]|nr:hypothetical protein [Candidatus Omnitrophota bacterium]
MSNQFPENEINLIRRYLVWCYKTTKEDLDRIDRYFTQNVVDEFLFKELIGSEEFKAASGNVEFKKKVQAFEDYKIEKFAKAREKKYSGGDQLRPEYLYLVKRLEAIAAAITHFLGKKELDQIIDSYEKEMTARILSAKEHS